MVFTDRTDAGNRLARELARYRTESPVVLALPRGGIEVAYPVAVALDAPLDVLCVRKIGAPNHEELGLGAVAEDGVEYVDQDLVSALHVEDVELTSRIARKKRAVDEQVRTFRRGRSRLPLAGRTVILVDDGIAMGATMKAALLSVRIHGPHRIVLAVPIAAPLALERLLPLADDVVALDMPDDLVAVGAWYGDFRQVSDERVIELLDQRAESLEHRTR